MMARWLPTLQQFQFTIVHRAGRDHSNADGLSRVPKTFLHGVRVVGPGPSGRPGMRPAMSTPHQPMGGRHRDDSPSTAHQQTRPVMSTPYLPTWDRIGTIRHRPSTNRHDRVMSTPYQPTLGQDRDLGPSSVRPVTPEVDTRCDDHRRRLAKVTGRRRPYNGSTNKSLNWPAWLGISGRWLTSMAGIRTRGRYSWFPIWTRPP